MSWRSNGNSNTELVDNLRKNGVIKSEAIFQVMSVTDRGYYTSENSYTDRPQSIGYKTTISAPHMHAHTLELFMDKLSVTNNATALDVGSGSGYLTVCLSRIIGENGKVYGVDHIPELINRSLESIQNDDPNLLLSGRIQMACRDGRLGYDPENKKFELYDVIHVGGAASQVPACLMNQLKKGGRLIMPVGPAGGTQVLQQWDKGEDGHINKRDLMKVCYGSLGDKNNQL